MSQLPAEIADRRHESELLQLRRMELVRQVVHGRRQVFDLGQQLLYPCAELARCLRGLLAEEIHPDRQERQALAQVVVQLTRDPPGFALPCLEQSAGEYPKSFSAWALAMVMTPSAPAMSIPLGAVSITCQYCLSARLRLALCASSATISPVWRAKTPMALMMCQWYRSQRLGSRKRTSLPGGRLAALMPQRRS